MTLLDGLRGQLSSDAGGEIRNLGANGNIYLIGNSNGAALSMRLASNAGDDLPIKGIVTKVTQLLAEPPRSGPGDLNYNQPGTGGPQVSILNIMGTSDTVIPYDGGSSGVFGDETSFQLMTALESMSTWSAHNGCDGTSLITSINYKTNADSDGEATFYDYQGCPEGVIVEHYAVIGAGHSFGQGASLDGVRIDNDLAYDFIIRVEGTDGGGGGGGGGGGSGPCEDDPDWYGKFNEAHDCAYIAEAPSNRCGYESTDGISASVACMAACGECDTTGDTPAPTPEPTPAPTVGSGNPPSPSCEDDPDWHGKFNEAHNCAYIGESPASRCGYESTDGTLASVACKAACNQCDVVETPAPTPVPTPAPTGGSASCEDDPDWHGKFNAAHDCAYVAEAPDARCGWESTDGTLAWDACKESCGEC